MQTVWVDAPSDGARLRDALARSTISSMRQRFGGFRDRLKRRAEAPAVTDEDSDVAAPDEVRRPLLAIGFGNPGSEYGNTRHNVGAWCIAALARRGGARLERHGRIDRATVQIDGRAMHLGRSRTFYNESGPAVAAELRRLHLSARDLLVIYDELDLPVARVRIRPHGGHGGNNGIKSLIGAVGSGEFARLRIGIDRPYDDGVPVREPERIARWVLAEPGDEERRQLREAVETSADAVELAVREGIDIAMNRYNQR